MPHAHRVTCTLFSLSVLKIGKLFQNAFAGMIHAKRMNIKPEQSCLLLEQPTFDMKNTALTAALLLLTMTQV